MEISENLDKMEDELQVLIEKCRLAKRKSDGASENLKILKEDLRIFMIDSGIEKHAGVEIRRTFSFSIPLLQSKFPDMAKRYVEIITTTSTTEKLSAKNKKLIKEEHPEVYREIIAENTPQVRGL